MTVTSGQVRWDKMGWSGVQCNTCCALFDAVTVYPSVCPTYKIQYVVAYGPLIPLQLYYRDSGNTISEFITRLIKYKQTYFQVSDPGSLVAFAIPLSIRTFLRETKGTAISYEKKAEVWSHPWSKMTVYKCKYFSFLVLYNFYFPLFVFMFLSVFLRGQCRSVSHHFFIIHFRAITLHLAYLSHKHRLLLLALWFST